MADQGYGQQTPNDASSELGAVAFIVRQMMAEMSTMKLVQVVSVTGGGEGQPAGTVVVLPLVSQIDGNGYGTPHENLPPIPWSRVQGGKNAIICDPVAGDIGYVVAADRDISKVKSTLAAALPGSRRQFDAADSVYAGGCLNVAPNQYLIFTVDGVRLVDSRNSSLAFTSTGFALTDGVNSNSVVSSSSGMTMTFAGGNKIIMAAGFVNIVAPQLQVNGIPVTIP